MTRVIWKFDLNVGEGGCQHAMPPGAKLVHVGAQEGHGMMWWSIPLVEARSPDRSHWELRTFTIVPTGPPGYVDDVLHYCGTFQIPPFVWHLFAWEEVERVA